MPRSASLGLALTFDAGEFLADARAEEAAAVTCREVLMRSAQRTFTTPTESLIRS
jgi:hypothetical protein